MQAFLEKNSKFGRFFLRKREKPPPEAGNRAPAAGISVKLR
jgi:hypothetical protein